jgi:hypothetical protein
MNELGAPPIKDAQTPNFDARVLSLTCGSISLISNALVLVAGELPGRFLGPLGIVLILTFASPAFIMPWIGIVAGSMSQKRGATAAIVLNILALFTLFGSLLFFASQMFPS